MTTTSPAKPATVTDSRFEPVIITPSAPSESARRTKVGSRRPEHISLIKRTFGAYFTRAVPARSAAR